MTATRALIDRVKRQASEMARPFIDAARQPNATEIERAFGEAARGILRDAEARAQRLPREDPVAPVRPRRVELAAVPTLS